MPKMDRETVVKAVTTSWDNRIERITGELEALRNPDHLTAKIAEWRKDCENRIASLATRLEGSTVTDEELSGWKLPNMPGKAEVWTIDQKDRELQTAFNAKEHALQYLAARKSDDDGAITLSQTELERVGFYKS